MVCDVLESPGLALVRDGHCVECFKSTVREVYLLVLVDEMPALRIAEAAGAEAHCRSYECLVAVCRRH